MRAHLAEEVEPGPAGIPDVDQRAEQRLLRGGARRGKVFGCRQPSDELGIPWANTPTNPRSRAESLSRPPLSAAHLEVPVGAGGAAVGAAGVR